MRTYTTRGAADGRDWDKNQWGGGRVGTDDAASLTAPHREQRQRTITGNTGERGERANEGKNARQTARHRRAATSVTVEGRGKRIVERHEHSSTAPAVAQPSIGGVVMPHRDGEILMRQGTALQRPRQLSAARGEASSWRKRHEPR